MFERFTEQARQVVVLAHEEARTLKHNYIGTEHLLLGLLREEEDLAARVLESLDITAERVRAQVVRIVGYGEQAIPGEIPFTARAKKVFELAHREALILGDKYIGTEHILLMLMREPEGTAVSILLDFGVDAEKIDNEVIRQRSRSGNRGTGSSPGEIEPGELGLSGMGPSAVLAEAFSLTLGPRIRRLLMSAAARALDDGRSNIEGRDLLTALTRHEETATVLAELGVDESAMHEAIERHRGPQEPPAA